MRLSRSILAIALLSGSLLSCKGGPARPNFMSEHKGKDATPETDPNDPDDPTDPKGDPTKPDPIALRNTLEKILQEAGGAQDAECAGANLTSRTALRLLTMDEYQNTVADILKVTTDYRGSLPTEVEVMGFRNNIDISKITDGHANSYLNAAINIADEIKSKLPCNQADGVSCATKVVDAYAAKLWRRPLEASEKTYLMGLHKTGLDSSPSEGMTMLIVGMLMSPNYLYRSEIGKSGALTPYELASALSYFFWGTAPDDALIAVAASGDINKEATLMAQADRLWSSPRSKFIGTEFVNSWLETKRVRGATKDAAKFPAFKEDIRNAMAAEAEDTFNYLLRQNKASFESLFTSDFSIGSDALAAYYKGQATKEGDVTKIKFPNTPRKGVLGLGAVLAQLATAIETHPIKRGDYVLKQLFCHIAPPTPPGLEVKIPEQKAGLTTRERFAIHTENPVCAGCHTAIDGIGFGMEDFDATGIYREMDNGKKVDNSGTIHDIDKAETKFAGVGELSSYIAESKQAKRCFVVQWYRLVHGHTERPADICAIRDIANKFEKENLTLPQLLVKIVTHSSFTKKGD